MNLSRTVKHSTDSSSPLQLIVRLLVPCVILSLGPSVTFAAWQDWFRTPEQQAAQLLENGDAKALIEKAPSESWKGHGHFQAGELDAATASFEQARKIAHESGNSEAVQRALFNAATTHVHNGRFDEAISKFDELLELNPDHESARHNKEVAEKMRMQQEQQQQQQSGGDGEQGDESPDSESGEPQDGQPESGQDSQQGGQQGESGENGEQSDSADESASADAAEDGHKANAGDSASDQEQADGGQDGKTVENSEAAARAALDAEQQLGSELAQSGDSGEPGSEEPVGVTAQEPDTPLTEQQQATEQWLRQIPDDPAGLLRNKLQQSHRLEYPGVQSSEERW